MLSKRRANALTPSKTFVRFLTGASPAISKPRRASGSRSLRGPSTPTISAYNGNPNANYFTENIRSYAPQQPKTTSSTYSQTTQNTAQNTGSTRQQSTTNPTAGYSAFLGLFNPFVPQSVSTPSVSK